MPQEAVARRTLWRRSHRNAIQKENLRQAGWIEAPSPFHCDEAMHGKSRTYSAASTVANNSPFMSGSGAVRILLALAALSTAVGKSAAVIPKVRNRGMFNSAPSARPHSMPSSIFHHLRQRRRANHPAISRSSLELSPRLSRPRTQLRPLPLITLLHFLP